MLQMSITVRGGRQVQRKLKRLGHDMHDMKKAMRDVADKLPDYYANEAWNSRGGVFRKRWPALSPKYRARKIKKFGAKPILEATGTMKNSFYGEFTKSTATISNNADYFKYHQSNAPRTVIPRRQMIGVNSRVKAIVKQAVEDDIRNKLRRA